MTPSQLTRVAGLPAATFAVWSAAWRAGRCSPDDVLHTLHGFAQVHEVDAGDGTGLPAGGSALELMALIGDAARVLVRLPAPGDPQGLPPGVLTAEVVTAGAGPEVVLIDDRAPGSNGPARPLSLVARGTPERCRWVLARVPSEVDLGAIATDSPGDLEYELRDAITDAAAIISGLGGPRRSGPADLRDALAARRSAVTLDLPPHDSARIDRLLASADQIDAILSLVDPSGIGTSGTQLDVAGTRLRQLAALTRRARAAALGALIRDYRRAGPR